MKRWIVIGTQLLALTSLTGGALAIGPTRADMDSCNQKAAQVTKATPVQPSTRSQPATPSSPSMQPDTSKPGTPVSPGPAAQPAPSTPQPGNNPSGGRITDSSPPGVPPSELGMAPIGETDPAYRQAYLACIMGKYLVATKSGRASDSGRITAGPGPTPVRPSLPGQRRRRRSCHDWHSAPRARLQ